MMGGRCGRLQMEGYGLGIVYGREDPRCEDVSKESILVPNQRKCLCELGLSIGVVFEGLGGGGGHGVSGGLLACGRRQLLPDRAEKGTH